jgi:hypothetical protein
LRFVSHIPAQQYILIGYTSLVNAGKERHHVLNYMTVADKCDMRVLTSSALSAKS